VLVASAAGNGASLKPSPMEKHKEAPTPIEMRALCTQCCRRLKFMEAQIIAEEARFADVEQKSDPRITRNDTKVCASIGHPIPEISGCFMRAFSCCFVIFRGSVSLSAE
jgi:hypothetical protein